MWQPLKTDFSKNKKRKAFIKGSLQFNWWDQRRLRGPRDVKTLDAASLGTLQASELFAEVVKLTECCEILLFKFIIMHESAPIERFTKAWVPKVHLKKKNEKTKHEMANKGIYLLPCDGYLGHHLKAKNVFSSFLAHKAHKGNCGAVGLHFTNVNTETCEAAKQHASPST